MATRKKCKIRIRSLFVLSSAALLAGCFHATSVATPHMTWKTDNDVMHISHLVCDSSGLVVAEVIPDSESSFTVAGGNGELYGAYSTLATAKKRAEGLVNSSSWIGSKWMECK